MIITHRFTVPKQRSMFWSMPSLLTRTLQAAEGFLELGDPQQAETELENLEGEDRTSKEVWVLR